MINDISKIVPDSLWMYDEDAKSILRLSGGRVYFTDGYDCALSDFISNAQSMDAESMIDNSVENDDYAIPNVMLDHNGIPLIDGNIPEEKPQSITGNVNKIKESKTEDNIYDVIVRSMKRSDVQFKIPIGIPTYESVNLITGNMDIDKSELVKAIADSLDLLDIKKSLENGLLTYYGIPIIEPVKI